MIVPEPEPGTEPGTDADPVQGSVSRKMVGGIQEKMDSARERARPRSFHSLVMTHEC